ncbi:MAG TPA: alpha/beta hydrolase [Candidatus Nitrosocosmicus sp.]|nr:alpha/beta hydrolase [Candidatus Nitrosocosmicus sp.]
MKTWIFEEYLSLPFVLYKMYRENVKETSGILRHKIQFGEDEYQYALVFRPEKAISPKRNTVFFIHGGGWAAGSPEGFAFVGKYFAKRGFNAVLGGYRHAPQYKYPAQLEDVYKALVIGMAFLKEHNAATDRIVTIGQSAGAQLAALLALDVEKAAANGIDPGIFSALILISGPVDFSTCDAKQINLGLHGFLRSKEAYAEADPIKLADSRSGLPVLCIHGGKDSIVDIRNSINFYSRLKGGSEEISKLVIAENKHHIDLLEMFMKSTEETEALTDFMNKIEKM